MTIQVEDIERVYRERYVRFRNGVATVTGTYESARDAVQEGFARAVASREQFRGNLAVDGTLEAWIWRITLRAALEQRAGLEQVDVQAVALDPQLPAEESDPELTAAVSALPPRRRLVLFLRYFADLSYSQIAIACGISEGTVAAALAQAHIALREKLVAEPEMAAEARIFAERR
jgi:RNA polymerase sigma factor (sigma-70 family)